MEPARNEPIDEFLKRQFGGSDIKPGTEDRLVRENPGFAGEIAKRLSAEPPPDGVYAPITHAMPAETPPIAYFMHNYTTRCLVCNTEHRHSETYALNHLRSRQGYGMVRNMSPIKEFRWNVPLQVHNLTTRTCTGCFECFDAVRDTILPSLPAPPPPPSTILKAGAPETPASVSGRKPKTPPTVDDLLV